MHSNTNTKCFSVSQQAFRIFYFLLIMKHSHIPKAKFCVGPAGYVSGSVQFYTVVVREV